MSERIEDTSDAQAEPVLRRGQPKLDQVIRLYRALGGGWNDEYPDL